jgi:hypothetical protein
MMPGASAELRKTTAASFLIAVRSVEHLADAVTGVADDGHL